MMLSIPAAGVVLILAWIHPSYALYFHIGETEKKCFIEEIPDETMVIGKSLLWGRQLDVASQQKRTAGSSKYAAMNMTVVTINNAWRFEETSN